MPPEEATTLELRDYLRVLRRRKWIIIVTMVLCVGAAIAMAVRQTPVYVAGTTVLVDKSLVEQQYVPGDATGANAQRALANQIQVMHGPDATKQVEALLGYAPSYGDIQPSSDSDVVGIQVRNENPKIAANTTNAYAATFIKVRSDLVIQDLDGAAAQIQKQIDETNAKVDFANGAINDPNVPVPPLVPSADGKNMVDPRIRQRDQFVAAVVQYNNKLSDLAVAKTVAETSGGKVITPAGVPKSPENRNPVNNILAGLAIGAVLGIALAFLREYLDDRIKTKDDLELASGQTVIGLIPELTDWKNREATQLVSIAQPRSPAAEAYRTVRTSVEFLSLDQPIGSLQVTSAMAGEGKTTTLANLAVTFARVGQRVIVLCCDLRRPRIHEFFGLTNRVGFTSMLLGDAPATEAIQAVRGDLPIGLVASGPLAPNPAELLASKRAVSVIEELDSQCDLLLIDSPPVLPVTDAQVISGLVDGVLLVGTAGLSTKRDMRRAVELLHQVDAPLIGSILNGVHSKHDSVYTYGDDRYYVDSTVGINGNGNGDRSGRRDRRNGGKRSKRSARSSS